MNNLRRGCKVISRSNITVIATELHQIPVLAVAYFYIWSNLILCTFSLNRSNTGDFGFPFLVAWSVVCYIRAPRRKIINGVNVNFHMISQLQIFLYTNSTSHNDIPDNRITSHPTSFVCRWTSTLLRSVPSAFSTCDNSVAALVDAFVGSRVDCCVGLLTGLPKKTTDSQVATCSQRSCAGRVKLRQVRTKTDSFPAPCFTLAGCHWPD